LLIDAKRFQFKTGGDARGMTDALMGVERWDPIKSSTILVWRDKEGKHFVADGHQRVNLAQRLEKKGQDIELYAHVINEDDGFNPATARAIGARKNLAEGTATEFDAARALKLDPDALDNLPPRSKYVQFAQGISQVADNVLVAAENMEVSPAYVSMIGRNFADATEQEAMLKLLNRLQPSNQTKAESIIAQAREAGFVTKKDVQQGLFGDEVLLENLFNERADVLDSSLKLINTEKQVFSTLVNNSDFIQKYGNKLDKTTNLQRKNLNAEIQETIKHNANVKGEISEELSRLARELQEGKVTLSQAARQFVERVGDRFRDGGFTRIDTRATRSHDDVKEILSQANEPKRTRETAEELEPYANTEMFDVDGLEQNVQALNDTMKDIDPNYQLDIDDAIANAKAEAESETGTDEAIDLQDDGIVAAEAELTQPVTAETEAETAPIGDSTDTSGADADADAGPPLGFIPAQTTSLPDGDSVPEAIETPAKRPASLINKISGLWSSKPSAAEPASRKEPAIGESQPTASILDLSRSDVVTSETTEPAKANLEMSDDELDIPAFLRRQAN